VVDEELEEEAGVGVGVGSAIALLPLEFTGETVILLPSFIFYEIHYNIIVDNFSIKRFLAINREYQILEILKIVRPLKTMMKLQLHIGFKGCAKNLCISSSGRSSTSCTTTVDPSDSFGILKAFYLNFAVSVGGCWSLPFIRLLHGRNPFKRRI
jgi:hypothetical protein